MPCSLFLFLSSTLSVFYGFNWGFLSFLSMSDILVFKIFFSGCPRVYNTHLQLIQVHFQITLYCFMGSANTLLKIKIPNSTLLSLYHCCYLFHLYTSIYIKISTLLVLLFWRNCYVIDQLRIRKISFYFTFNYLFSNVLPCIM